MLTAGCYGAADGALVATALATALVTAGVPRVVLCPRPREEEAGEDVTRVDEKKEEEEDGYSNAAAVRSLGCTVVVIVATPAVGRNTGGARCGPLALPAACASAPRCAWTSALRAAPRPTRAPGVSSCAGAGGGSCVGGAAQGRQRPRGGSVDGSGAHHLPA